MELKIFNYAAEVIERLDDMRIDLDIACREIEQYFSKIIAYSCDGYLNINSRVKSKDSLKEKILRHDYYNKFKTVDGLYENLSDLIGVRLECRFVEDERTIYKLLKAHFKNEHNIHMGYFYREDNPNILVELDSKQPKEQKNGLNMYRIDGKYLYQDQIINFELQIKSLINIFWSEIEHKIIYKNYNYMIADGFFKDIMRSIKNSLSTIDQQLLLISNEFERGKSNTVETRKSQLEMLLSKAIYDLFAARMKNDIGLLVDFRKACDTLVKYVFRDVDLETSDIYNGVFLTSLNRMGEIDRKEINFNTELVFEKEPAFPDEFSQIVGNHIKSMINVEFQWNLFFRILFHIEPEDNTADLEKFILFYKNRICGNFDTQTLIENVDEKFVDSIIDSLSIQFAKTFVQINKIDLLYDNAMQQLRNILTKLVAVISDNVETEADWIQNEHIYLKFLALRIFALFDYYIEPTIIVELIEKIRKSHIDIEIPKSLLKYITQL